MNVEEFAKTALVVFSQCLDIQVFKHIEGPESLLTIFEDPLSQLGKGCTGTFMVTENFLINPSDVGAE